MRPLPARPRIACALAALLLLGAVLGCSGERVQAPPGRADGSAAPAEPAEPDTRIDALRTSVHAKLDCSDCHGRQARAPGPGTSFEKARCDHCHAEVTRAYDQSIHGQVLAQGKTDAARCVHCHGAHDIHAAKDARSRVYRLRLPTTCGGCHKNPELARRLGISQPRAASLYVESIHGRALLKDGLVVAPSCVECHGSSHDIRKASDPRSSVHPRNVPHTCGRCHAGIDAAYERSVHGRALAAGKRRAAECVDCHSAHEIAAPADPSFKLLSDERCGRCHQNRLRRYRETYHGRAAALGLAAVASCADCHGHHDVLPVADPGSRLSAQNRLATCRQCHPSAPHNFANFMAHGDHSDRKNYPGLYWAYLLMTALLVGVFGFIGAHTLLWLGRTLLHWRRDPRAFAEAKRRARDERGARLFERFRPVDRFCHLLVITSFMLLVLTGMPLKFYYTSWAQDVFEVIGGAVVAAFLHRVGAVMTFSYFAIHIASLVSLVRRARERYCDETGKLCLRRLLGFVFGPDSPMPRLQDAKDLWAHLKWFLGRGPRPRFDRWTYYEKFDYFAVFWGVAIIGLSGLVMWFPTRATVLLPGWAINLSHIIHSDEALLAAGFIFVFHFLNSNLRPEKFPFDVVMFSGRITEEEMRHERPALYARLVAEGRLDPRPPSEDWARGWNTIMRTFAAAALATGLALAAAIFWALATH
ncbi:MAG: hypothetical protein HY744_16570 [Deltaproteobacteria bacterium]|nr:hypothetical protein [Deltaproteobacteria bacterium]